MDTRVRRSLTALTVFVLAGVVAGVAWATIPDGTGTIHSCFSASDKSLRVVDTGSCAKGEAPVSWNQNAIQGLQGQQGSQGPQGDTGPQGLAGLTFGSTQNGNLFTDPVIGGGFASLTCPTGQKALEGGWNWWVLDGSTKMDQPDVESFPIGDDSWGFAVGANSTYAGEPLAITLTCVNAG
jgi:hypothetical protein